MKKYILVSILSTMSYITSMDLNQLLRSAIFDKDIVKMQECIEQGANINLCDDTCGDTPLHYAAINSSRVEALKLLLSLGANPTKTNQRGQTPLHVAIKHQAVDAIRVLLDADIPINTAYYSDYAATYLHQAAFMESEEVVQLLIDHGAEKEKTNKDGETPLHCANTVTAKVLLYNGATSNPANIYGETPLHYATKSDSSATGFEILYKQVLLLLHYNADIGKRDMFGKTPLHRAAYRGHQKTIKALLLKANPHIVNTADNNGYTALHLAAQQADTNTVQLLLQAGANPFACDKQGKTALNLNPQVKQVIQRYFDLVKKLAYLNFSKDDQEKPLVQLPLEIKKIIAGHLLVSENIS